VGIRIEDIAKVAGVSTATVSRAINTPEQVRPNTRQRVEKVIKQLGYKPNYFAQGLMKGRTDVVGVLVSYHTNPYFTDIIDSIGHVLSQNGIYLYLCNCEKKIELEAEYTNELLRRNIDALIVVETPSLNTADNYFTQRTFDCPVILVNQHIKPFGEHYIIRCDQTPGIGELFDYVRQHELFPFLLFFGAEQSYSFSLKEDLFIKWKHKYRISDGDARIYKHPTLVDTNDENTVWYTCETIKELLSSPSRPRSIFAANELMAVGAMTAARELSISVPDELALVGIDNTMLSRISHPPLSTIDLRMKEVGAMAAELYLEIKRDPAKERPKIQTIPSRMYFRNSL
jgi:LacI family transcriptional regulator